MIIIDRKSERELLSLIQQNGSGSIVSYFGYVRGEVDGKIVSNMLCKKREDSMKIMEKIENEIREKFPVIDVILYHSLGDLKVGELVAAVIVSSVHRAEGFEACRYGIDKIKELEPVERKDIFKE